MTTLRYFAGARAAAGTSTEQTSATTLAEALDQARASRDQRFGDVLAVCALLVDGAPLGSRDPADVPLDGVELVDVLPPFAGG
ncbi:MAG TPA: MoaD/ThiS family protein [Mycobacteriales bacterium]|nr:MoaD/ThiS family protein [Mycobacteriales bacterium]